MEPNEQNLHFAELRQKVRLYIHALVLQRGLPSFDGKLERFVTKSGKSGCQTRVRQTIVNGYNYCIYFLASMMMYPSLTGIMS